MKIAVKQGNEFLVDQIFAAAKESYQNQTGILLYTLYRYGGNQVFRFEDAVYKMTMIETIINNPFPVKECPGKNTYAINTEQDCVFYKDNRFELITDARGFQNKDISCQMNKNKVTVSGKNTFKAIFTPWLTHNKRKLRTSYRLPRNIDPHKSTCFISSEGILVVTAPWELK